ncbi:hypothetical protein KUTeg_009581 [Tegillarca granosa]|uniref:Uncharacterized protein n=1 Tax=Tegillarca granosa TaxID=220873 RepID=A0ABQ9F9E2_TEGGR|nr:hypothetical protein KUTeg_009581 [Tegillarca granosa]
MYSQYCQVIDGHGISAASESDSKEGDLYLVPDKPRLYHFTFLAVREDVDQQLEISTIVLEFGSESGKRCMLRWMGGGGDAVVPLQTAQSLLPKKPVTTDHIDWESVDIKSSTR